VSHEHLTTFPEDPLLDLDPWVGQRQCTFRFDRINGVTGEILGQVYPIRGATLTHDTTRTIKRQLNLALGAADTATINVISDRILVFMVFPNGTEYPLGKYMFTDNSKQFFTSGELANVALNDEMFLVDQQITKGIAGNGGPTMTVVQDVLNDLPITYVMEPSALPAVGSWTVGAGRGSVLEALAKTGDYFSPWFGNDTKMHWLRSFDSSDGRLPDLDFDTGNKVLRAGIVQTSDLITAPNKFIVISNSATDPSTPVVGEALIDPSAPHSVVNRGFEIPETQDLQLADAIQAAAVAQNLANRQTIFERVTLSTAPDPRHDSYTVIRWQGSHWLELAWSMALVEGGAMGHLLRKVYGGI
jgi:hypothetical protein